MTSCTMVIGYANNRAYSNTKKVEFYQDVEVLCNSKKIAVCIAFFW